MLLKALCTHACQSIRSHGTCLPPLEQQQQQQHTPSCHAYQRVEMMMMMLKLVGMRARRRSWSSEDVDSAWYTEVVAAFKRGLQLGVVSVDAAALINDMVGIVDPMVCLCILYCCLCMLFCCSVGLVISKRSAAAVSHGRIYWNRCSVGRRCHSISCAVVSFVRWR